MALTGKAAEVVERVQVLSDAYAEVLDIFETVLADAAGDDDVIVRIPAPLVQQIRHHLAAN